MINFACNKIKLEDIIKCGLGLTKSEYRILMHISETEHNWFTSTDLAEELNLNLTTVQKSLKKLHERGVLLRSQTNFQKGGYIFIYKLKPKETVIEIILNIVKSWTKQVEHELKKW